MKPQKLLMYPPETAPKDGSEILAVWKRFPTTPTPSVARDGGISWQTLGHPGLLGTSDMIAWAPLPEPVVVQPMETAPRDGRIIRVYHPNPKVESSLFSIDHQGRECWQMNEMNGAVVGDPIGWTPIPEGDK